MGEYVPILGLIWAIFIIVWVVGMFSAKRTVYRSWSGIWWRVAIVISVIALVRALRGSPYLEGGVPFPPLNIAGIVLASFGIALAIWARRNLGRNWGMPLSVKENAELVTTGPYAYVRHPIYAGILLALFGSGLVIWWWLIIFSCSLVYFLLFVVGGEEELMLKQFPAVYPAYKARTRRLIPRVY